MREAKKTVDQINNNCNFVCFPYAFLYYNKR